MPATNAIREALGTAVIACAYQAKQSADSTILGTEAVAKAYAEAAKMLSDAIVSLSDLV